MAYWLIIVSVIAIAAVCPHSHRQMRETQCNHSELIREISGTNCSVFNYNKSCCIPGAECIVKNGNKKCLCSPECYYPESDIKCCEDIHCPDGTKPLTCQDYGCCYANYPNQCYCEEAPLYPDGDQEIITNCRNQEESCPKTCSAAKKSTGYCKWEYPKLNVSCYVEQGKCFCDEFCVSFNDCCEDITGFLNMHGRYRPSQMPLYGRYRHQMPLVNVSLQLLTDEGNASFSSTSSVCSFADDNNVRTP